MKNTNEYTDVLSELYENSNQLYQKLILFVQKNANVVNVSFYNKLIETNNEFFAKNITPSAKNTETNEQINVFFLSRIILLNNDVHSLQTSKNKKKVRSLIGFILILITFAFVGDNSTPHHL